MRFLLLRFSSIGDIILTTPIIRCIKKAYPDSEIHYATKEQFAPLLLENPYISRLWLLKGNDKEFIASLKEVGFDRIIDLHKNLRTLRIKKALGAQAISFNKLNLEKWLITNLGIDRLPDKHLVERYFDAIKSLGVSYDGQGLDMFFSSSVPEIAELLPEPFSNNGYMALVLGANHNTKRLPEQRWHELIPKLEANLVLLGGAKEREEGNKLAKEFSGKCFNACGALTLQESARVIKDSHVVITPDTGMMHIAAALDRPILSIWGNTIPRFGMYPYMREGMKLKSSIFQVDNLDCRPCSKLGYQQCPKKHFNCMNQQDLDAIAAQAMAYYQSS